MADEGFNNQDTPNPARPEDINAPTRKKPLRALLIVFLIFSAFIVTVFLTQRKVPIDWVEDYEEGLELAKKQNKPVLLAFYKQFTRMSTSTFNNTYNNPDVKEFVEQNFVPILYAQPMQFERKAIWKWKASAEQSEKSPEQALSICGRRHLSISLWLTAVHLIWTV